MKRLINDDDDDDNDYSTIFVLIIKLDRAQNDTISMNG